MLMVLTEAPGAVSGLLKALSLPKEAKPRSAAYRGVDFLVSSVSK